MWKRARWLTIIAVALVFLAYQRPVEKYFDIAKSLDIFATLFKEVNAYYVDEVEPEKLVRKGIEGMLESLDPYTDYIAEEDLENFRISTTGQYGGIGALIGVINDKTVITHPYKSFPAYNAGIRVGDEIVSVNGKKVQGKSTGEISTMLKGQPNTEVELSIKRPGQRENTSVRIRREKIVLSNLSYAGLVDPDIGYIKLDDFTPGASRELSGALLRLKEQGAKSIILDLRDNPGGLLQEAVNIVNLFVAKGREVVFTKGKVDDWNKSYKTLNNPVDVEIPLVVLVSEESASASEIVAGALQDYDRGLLMGKRTYGKGLVQTTRPLAYNSQLKITTAKYYIPSGRCIQAVDYTHRHVDGSVDRVADSLKSEFKTRHGRKVFDGGGLDPDITTEDDYVGALTAALVNSGFIFEYATKYCAQNQKPSWKSFQLGDNDYNNFRRYLQEQKFSYATPIERNAKQLIDAAKKERYYNELENSLGTLRERIELVKEKDFDRFKVEILEVLEEQIAFHYDLNEGLAAVSLARDNAIVEARKILHNTEEYNKTLAIANDPPSEH